MVESNWLRSEQFVSMRIPSKMSSSQTGNKIGPPTISFYVG
ncbi:hypothetical protein HanXRQr2_Chr07g0303591 [Helianthus annuus]|uniref:Uncharacterized protein n=1 Tax=Helianthus annuus TaxID=4232 RepID=A0A9K3IM60_HELAN|nr:hypothetical protein HanXRQr2_Chr07g0303591 [Helianthus annuus]KAJ0905423.1 hypothetical protein HanPSC8_Chr07g0293851 [Helianthus annuus]